MKACYMTITMLQTVSKLDNKWLRYSKIESINSNMLENASQHIACDFDVSQQLWNVPSGMVCDASRSLRIAGKCPSISSQSVTGPFEGQQSLSEICVLRANRMNRLTTI